MAPGPLDPGADRSDKELSQQEANLAAMLEDVFGNVATDVHEDQMPRILQRGATGWVVSDENLSFIREVASAMAGAVRQQAGDDPGAFHPNLYEGDIVEEAGWQLRADTTLADGYAKDLEVLASAMCGNELGPDECLACARALTHIRRSMWLGAGSPQGWVEDPEPKDAAQLAYIIMMALAEDMLLAAQLGE